MSAQEDIQYYRRRAAEARARGKETLAQTMENYASNLEAGIYDDDGAGAFDIGASNRRWAEQERLEREKEARRRAAEERLYAQQPRRSGGGGGGGGYSAPSYSYGNSNPENAGYNVPPMDYAQPNTRSDRVNPSYDPGDEDFNQGSWSEARRPAPARISNGDYWDRGSNSNSGRSNREKASDILKENNWDFDRARRLLESDWWH